MEKIQNILIIGGGISAHTAALYNARASLSPLILSGKTLDQLSTTTLVENYPGFPEGVMGPELIQKCRQQAERFGAQYMEEEALSLSAKKGYYEVKTSSGTHKSRTVIICTGASARTLNIPGEKEFWAKGVSTCAPCDAPLFRNKSVVVIGGGDSAMEESIMLTKFAKKVTIIHRRDEFRASKIMQDRVLSEKAKIAIVWDSTVSEVYGDKFVKGVKVQNLKTNKITDLQAEGMFLAIGHIPNTAWLKGSGIKLDEEGYIPSVKTNLPGVFAAGDVMDLHYRQAVTSAGTGCMAALEAEKYIEQLKGTGKY